MENFRDWEKFLTPKALSMNMKGHVNIACIKLKLRGVWGVSDSEIWAIRADHDSKMESAQMRMIRWMCDVSRRDPRLTAKYYEE